MMKSNILICIIVAMFLLPTVSAWARHDIITKESIQDMGWLDRFNDLEVTEYSYADDSIRNLPLKYYNEDPAAPSVDDFTYYELEEHMFYFKGSDIGNHTGAEQVIIDFVDEVDWGMDQELNLSWMQSFHCDSQGYRHMYYPAGTFHIPMGMAAQGATPERVVHFYGLAKQAFEKDDPYWGFRFLARAMHYVQDMSQPYHTRQFSWRQIVWTNPYFGTVQAITNYHFAYESYQANRLRLETQGALPLKFVSAIRYSLPIYVEDTDSLVENVAYRGYWGSSKTVKYSIDFLGKHYKNSDVVEMGSDEFFNLIARDDEAAKLFNDELEQRMFQVGKATKSFLEFARRDLDLDNYPLD
ncbi:MAG: hypothetical protein V1729_03765 [Candidatus Woesearchaeota archaeon]